LITIQRHNRNQIPFDQLKDLYSGKWILLVNQTGDYLSPNENGELEPCDPISAEVLIVADSPYEGSETGIYKELKANRSAYGWMGEMDLRSGIILPSNFFC